MRKEREYKEKVLEMKVSQMCTDDNKFKNTMRQSNSDMLDILDRGESVSVESCRQSGRALTAMCYAAQIMMNEELKIIIYTNRNIDESAKILLFKELIKNNGGDSMIVDNLLICNPSKKELKRMDLVNEVGLIIYEDIWMTSKNYHRIDLKTAAKVQSIISSCDNTDISKRTGFDLFEKIRYEWNKDPIVSTGECRNLSWFDNMCRAMCLDWQSIRKEILMEHNPSNNPVDISEFRCAEPKLIDPAFIKCSKEETKVEEYNGMKIIAADINDRRDVQLLSVDDNTKKRITDMHIF